MTPAPTHRRTAPPAPRDAARLRRAAFRALVPLCVAASAMVACSRGEPAPSAATTENDVPVAVNSGSPFQYPLDLWEEGVEGEVRLRLYVDSAGRVQPESTRVASGSGSPALDSAAMRGAALLLFAPAHRNGRAVGMAFYQPVVFRHGGEPAGTPNP